MNTITWFNSSPDCGDPTCLCSWCEELITEDDAPAIRLFDRDTNREARFHRRCINPALYGSGLLPGTHGIDDEVAL
jgi:hypothetical protein